MISNRAAGLAVCVAFFAGLLASLALRPPGEGATGYDTGDADSSSERRIHWRLPISITSTTPILGQVPGWVTAMLDAASSGAVQLDVYDPGELVPAFSITDAVREGKVPAGHTWLGYDQGKIPASALFAATPFGLEPWEYLGWWYEGGGKELADELYARHSIKPLLCGIIGPETAGWFREPIESLADIRGLKIRFAGIGGKVMERAGASVTMLPGSEIYQALEKGAIDATEFSLPAMDQALGFDRIAKNNYFPGWHQPFTAVHMVVNLATWDAIAPSDQQLMIQACDAGTLRTLAASEARQGAVIAGFADLGVNARYLDNDILRELQRLSVEVMEEESRRDADFARVLDSQNAFRAEYLHWKRLGYLPRDF
jgi:TRAP-type mannitol/chloroaromatic compound transport system substrate-binding protein